MQVQLKALRNNNGIFLGYRIEKLVGALCLELEGYENKFPGDTASLVYLTEFLVKKRCEVEVSY